MPRGPDLTLQQAAPCEDLSATELAYLAGFEGILDRALEYARPGERFVYGIHEALPSPLANCVVRRYKSAGWSLVEMIPGLTGAATLVLEP